MEKSYRPYSYKKKKEEEGITDVQAMGEVQW